MITKEELVRLMNSVESYRVELTISTTNMDKLSEAICAFANDLPNSRQSGYLIIGVHDDGKLSGLKVNDTLKKKITAIRSDGNILPLPQMTVESFPFDEGDVLVVEVAPSLMPPVRYRGRTFVRIGPRRDIATEAEERILIERRAANVATFDVTPCFGAKLSDIYVEKILQGYLPQAVSQDAMAQDNRSVEEKLAAVGLYDVENNCPTYGAIVLFGNNVQKFLPGCYIQFVRFAGQDKASQILDEREFKSCYFDLLQQLDSFLDLSIVRRAPVPVSTLREVNVNNYPQWAIRELIINGLMHRDMQSNMPLRLYVFEDYIEIMNPGGLYGQARPENFPHVNDYRNPLIAEAMKVLGYVNKYNRGIDRVQSLLKENSNPAAEFNVGLITAFAVKVTQSQMLSKTLSQAEGDLSRVNSDLSKAEDGLSQPQGDFVPTLSQPQGDFAPTLSQPQGDFAPTLPQPQGDFAPTLPQPQGDFAPTLPQPRKIVGTPEFVIKRILGEKKTEEEVLVLTKIWNQLSQEDSSLKVLKELVGATTTSRFRKRFIVPLIEAGWVSKTIPYNDHHPKQKYHLNTESSDFIINHDLKNNKYDDTITD